MPAGLLAGSREAGCAMFRTVAASDVFAMDLDVNDIRRQSDPRRFNYGH